MVPKLVTLIKNGYTARMFGKDVLAGITVGIIALPLAIAFAIGAGATPAQGLWTGIIAGISIALLSGSQFQISGPTGAFVVIIAGVIAEHGMSGLIIATVLAGILLVLMGLSGLGTLIKYIPYPVTTGFTTGIGFVIAAGQLKDFFGLSIPDYPSEFFERIVSAVRYFPSIDLLSALLGLSVIVIIFLVRRFAPRLPAAVIAIALVSLAALLLKLPVETIGSRYGAIPRGFPDFALQPVSLALIRDIFPAALTIALLGAIESLLSAVVADGMTGTRHNANMELVAQGAGNILSGLFGGIPATGAIARTAANIKNGAVSPVSSIVHALVLLMFTLLLSGLAARIPLAALAAVLLVVAWDMSELERFFAMRHAPRSDFLVMLVTFGLTIFIDLTVAVEVGMLLAVVLFLRRVIDTSTVSPLFLMEAEDTADVSTAERAERIPGCEVFEIIGPFFFGTADLLQDVLDRTVHHPKVFVLRMRRVPAIDATGMNALKSFLRHCQRQGTILILSGVRDQPRKALSEIGLLSEIGVNNIYDNFSEAMVKARQIVALKS